MSTLPVRHRRCPASQPAATEPGQIPHRVSDLPAPHLPVPHTPSCLPRYREGPVSNTQHRPPAEACQPRENISKNKNPTPLQALWGPTRHRPCWNPGQGFPVLFGGGFFYGPRAPGEEGTRSGGGHQQTDYLGIAWKGFPGGGRAERGRGARQVPPENKQRLNIYRF